MFVDDAFDYVNWVDRFKDILRLIAGFNIAEALSL